MTLRPFVREDQPSADVRQLGQAPGQQPQPWRPTRGLPVWWLSVVGALALVFVLQVSAVWMSSPGSTQAAWWPAAGVAVCLLLLSPRDRTWLLLALIWVVSAVAGVVSGRPPALVMVVATASVVEVAIVVRLLTHGGRDRARLSAIEDFGRLLVAALTGSAVAGAMIGAVVSRTEELSVLAAISVMASHASSLLLIVPLAIFVDQREHVRHSLAELFAQGTLLAVATALLLWPGQSFPLTAMPIPLLVWAALRLGPLVLCVEVLLLGAAATFATHNGWGPFGALADQISPSEIGVLLQVYLSVLVMVSVPLAIAIGQREAALASALAGRETYRRVISESRVGKLLLRLTPEGPIVVQANQPAADLLHTSVDSMEGDVWEAGLTAAQRVEIETMCRAFTLGRTDRQDRDLRLRVAQPTWVRLVLSWVPRTPDGDLVVAQLVDLTEVREAQHELERERDFIAATLDTAESVIVVVDCWGHVVRVNRAVERLCGVTEADLVDQLVWNVLIAPECRDDVRRQLDGQNARLDHERVSGQHEWLSADGGLRTVSWACVRQRPEDPTSLRVVTGIDVSDERAAHELFENVLDATIGTSIVGTDRDGTIVFFNLGAERLLGYSAEELVGKATPAAFHDAIELQFRGAELGVPPGLEVVIRQARETGQPDRQDWTYVRKDEERITVSLTVSPMRGGGDLVGFLCVAEDVTDRRREELALASALEQEREAVGRLEELDQIKSDFVSSVSHELRTPMTSVLGFSRLLASTSTGPLNDRQRDLVDRVARNGNRLMRLIEDLLVLSRIESRTWDVARDFVDLATIADRALEATGELRRGRDLRLTVDLACKSPPVVAGDSDKLEQVVTNLLSNAIKFTPDKGLVELTLGTTNQQAVLTVRDTGIGIAEDEQEHLFERFYRTPAAARAAIPGSGLGLAIARAIVEAHDGRISVTSTPGKGTWFDVVLPLAGS